MFFANHKKSVKKQIGLNGIEISKCTGCHACAQICPHNAIMMEPTDDGFLYPHIDSLKCSDCGKCYIVCPAKEDFQIKPYYRCYSCFSKDEDIIEASSSGGVFFHLAETILSTGGVVFGSAYDSENQECRHISTDYVPLTSLLRSKYVQSRIGNAFQEVLQALRQGRQVLFCGTPCQIRGLKKFLEVRKCYDAPLTVDFMCHGVPSPMIFRMFISALEQEKKQKLVDITFREKDFGWQKQVVKAYFENGEIYRQISLKENYYYFYFLYNYSLRDSCYSCNEYCAHLSDITLADDWVSGEKKNNKGTSLVFINSEKGNELFSAIRDKLMINETNVDVSVYSHQKYSYNKPLLMKALEEKGYDYISEEMYIKLRNKVERLEKVRHYKEKIRKIITR